MCRTGHISVAEIEIGLLGLEHAQMSFNFALVIPVKLIILQGFNVFLKNVNHIGTELFKMKLPAQLIIAVPIANQRFIDEGNGEPPAYPQEQVVIFKGAVPGVKIAGGLKYLFPAKTCGS